MTRTEPFLSLGEDGKFLREVRSDSGDKTSPTFIKSSMKTNWTFITKEVWVPAFMEQDGIRHFPIGGGMTTYPENNKQTSERLFEGGWHDADQFIRNVIGTGGFVVAEAAEGAVESV